jgi:acyl carrier protein
MIESRLKQYILENFLPGEDPELLTQTTPLVTTGILDSLNILKLATFLEFEFDIELGPLDLIEENLETIERIRGLVESKRRR